MKKTIIITLSLLLVLSLAACSGSDSGGGITVNGHTIGQKELNDRVQTEARINGIDLDAEEMKNYKEMFTEHVLDVMISEFLLREEAARQAITLSAEAVAAELAEFKQSFPSEENFREYLEYMGITEEVLKVRLETDVLINELFQRMTADIKADIEEIKEFYEEHAGNYIIPEYVKASHVLLETKEEAEEVLSALLAGADIGELAAERSIDPSAAINKGDLDYFARGKMVAPFEEAAFSLQPGEIYPEPVESQFGFHIIQVFDRTAAEERTLEEAWEEIEEAVLGEKKWTYFEDIIDKLKENAEIVK